MYSFGHGGRYQFKIVTSLQGTLSISYHPHPKAAILSIIKFNIRIFSSPQQLGGLLFVPSPFSKSRWPIDTFPIDRHRADPLLRLGISNDLSRKSLYPTFRNAAYYRQSPASAM